MEMCPKLWCASVENSLTALVNEEVLERRGCGRDTYKMGRRLTLGFIYDDKLTFHLLFFAIYIKCQDRTFDILYDYIIKDKGGQV
jgi:hypothetical protein